MTCIFCAIVAGAAPHSTVVEDAATLAFMDIMPATPGHLLVVPKSHATSLADVPPDTAGAMMRTAMRCAAALRASSLRTEGINLFLADGAAAGQEVFHTHLHVLPRFAGDGFGLSIRYGPAPPREMLDRQASQLAGLVAQEGR